MKPTLYLMVGYPGSGKTTVARYIHELTGAEHLWADQERKRMFGATYQTGQSTELYEALNEHTLRQLTEGKSIIFDTNFGFRSDRDKLRDIATQAEAACIVVWLTTSKELSESRATGNAEDPTTRVFAMTHADFARVTQHFQAPGADENPICLEGQGLTQKQVAQALNI